MAQQWYFCKVKETVSFTRRIGGPVVNKVDKTNLLDIKPNEKRGGSILWNEILALWYLLVLLTSVDLGKESLEQHFK